MEAIPETKVRALIYLKQDGHEITWDCELDWAEISTNEQTPPITIDMQIPGIPPEDFSIRGKPKSVMLHAGSALFESELRTRFDELWRRIRPWAMDEFQGEEKELAFEVYLAAHGIGPHAR